MGLFTFEDATVQELYNELLHRLDGTENCFDPNLVSIETEEKPSFGESVTDLYVEPYTNGLSEKRAAALCAGCHVIEECKAYAMAAQEPYGVWGGTTPGMRGMKRGKRKR